MTSRNDIYAALFALTDNLDLGSAGALVTASRKFKHFADVPAEAQPALYQTEHSEQQVTLTGMQAKRRLHASWTVYLRSDSSDDEDQPALRVNDVMDALEAALLPPPWSDTQTLGGLVVHAFIDGAIIKIPGDDDGQGMLVVPITLLIP